MYRAPHSNWIEDVVRNLVSIFWNDNTCTSSTIRDFIKHRIGLDCYDLHVKHWLDTTKHKFYVSFTKSNPHIKIGQTMFKNLRSFM